MKESLHDARQELKRIDHSVYVSLKYTRTVDVIRNILQRMVNTFGFGSTALLKFAVEQGKIGEFPKSMLLRAELVRGLYTGEEFSEELRDMIDFFLLLRKLNKTEDYTKIKEYRRHVAMITSIDGKGYEINLDEINEYYARTKRFIELVNEIIYGKEDD